MKLSLSSSKTSHGIVMTLPLPCRERLSDTISRCPTTPAEQRHSIAATLALIRSAPHPTEVFVSLSVSLTLQVLDFQWSYYRFEPCIAPQLLAVVPASLNKPNPGPST